MPTVIVPVGLSLGPSYRYVTPPDPTPEHWEVRLGAESEELDAGEFQVWGRAFLDPERHARLEVNRDTLRRDLIAAGKGPADPGAAIERLLERGLLVEFDTDGNLEKVFRRVKLFPIAEGMGNTPDEPDRYHIGHNGVSLVKTTYTVYGMVAFSSMVARTLWEACVDFEQGADEMRQAGEDVEAATADEVAREVAIVVPMLIASGCAFFDLVR